MIINNPFDLDLKNVRRSAIAEFNKVMEGLEYFVLNPSDSNMVRHKTDLIDLFKRGLNVLADIGNDDV